MVDRVGIAVGNRRDRVLCYQECASEITLETPAVLLLGRFRTWICTM